MTPQQEQILALAREHGVRNDDPKAPFGGLAELNDEDWILCEAGLLAFAAALIALGKAEQ